MSSGRQCKAHKLKWRNRYMGIVRHINKVQVGDKKKN